MIPLRTQANNQQQPQNVAPEQQQPQQDQGHQQRVDVTIGAGQLPENTPIGNLFNQILGGSGGLGGGQGMEGLGGLGGLLGQLSGGGGQGNDGLGGILNLANQFLGGIQGNGQEGPSDNNATAHVFVEQVNGEGDDDIWEDVDESNNNTGEQGNGQPIGNGQNIINNLLNMNMDMTLTDVIRENNWIDDGQGEFDILGVCVSELNITEIMALLNGDKSVLSNKQMQIKKKLAELYEKENNDHEAVKKRFAEDFEKSFLNIKDSQVTCYEGFDPHMVIEGVVDNHFDNIIATINKDYSVDEHPDFGEVIFLSF